MTLIYGAAGTEKTYLMNHISQFFDREKKLYLSNTNTSVDNLRRKIKANNCTYYTISTFLKKNRFQTEYDIIFIDECSMVCNSDLRKVIEKASFKLLVLVGDTSQIESISFGNWFRMAKYFVKKNTFHELKNLYRTNNQKLLDLWTKVRENHDDITECLVHSGWSSPLDLSLFEQKEDDEIILCLNYSGIYGINNINRLLQKNNLNQEIIWGLGIYKVGDPILFNEINRFPGVIYNNLKGKILKIDKKKEKIWFEIELNIVLNELDVENLDIKLISTYNNKTTIGFWVYKKEENEDDSDGNINTIVPFNIAYAISIHKAQGLEYNSVKIIIAENVEDKISHSIFYTAITRAKNILKIYWSPETMNRIIKNFNKHDILYDVNIFLNHSKLKCNKKIDKNIS